MQIFQAALEYKESSFDSSNKFWEVVAIQSLGDDSHVVGYFVVKTHLGRQFTRVDSSRRDAGITLQRGGPRVFKTIDAAVSAIRQIGQDSVEVKL